MTRAARWLLLIYFTAFGWLTYIAATSIERGETGRAVSIYAAAIGLMVAAAREVGHNGTAQATAVRTRRPRPHTWPSDLKALWRADLADTCSCELWWTTLGAFHDWDCPQLARNINHHHEEN